MEQSGETLRDLGLLEEIDRDPDTTQASMATRLGVAVGTVNWHVKRLIAKGYVKVKRAERRKLKYIITPEGLALRGRLTVAYVENSMTLYRRAREAGAQGAGRRTPTGVPGGQRPGPRGHRRRLSPDLPGVRDGGRRARIGGRRPDPADRRHGHFPAFARSEEMSGPMPEIVCT